MKMNSAMSSLIGVTPNRADLPAELRGLIDAGLISVEDETYLRALHRLRLSSASALHNATARESFINCIHIDEFVDGGREQLLAASLAAVDQLRRHSTNNRLRFIIGLSRSDTGETPEFETCTLRFHTLRDGQAWIADDLEAYEEPVLVIDSDE
jgi:hypothetical protein